MDSYHFYKAQELYIKLKTLSTKGFAVRKHVMWDESLYVIINNNDLNEYILIGDEMSLTNAIDLLIEGKSIQDLNYLGNDKVFGNSGFDLLKFLQDNVFKD